VYSNPAVPAGATTEWATQDSTSSPRTSYGRVQPYAGSKAQVQKQSGGNTWYSVNNPSPPTGSPATPFNWLTHLDRQLISPMELLNVSAFKPHELTQQFNSPSFSATPIPGAAGPGTTPCYYGHRAPW